MEHEPGDPDKLWLKGSEGPPPPPGTRQNLWVRLRERAGGADMEMEGEAEAAYLSRCGKHIVSLSP